MTDAQVCAHVASYTIAHIRNRLSFGNVDEAEQRHLSELADLVHNVSHWVLEDDPLTTLIEFSGYLSDEARTHVNQLVFRFTPDPSS